MWSCDSSNQWYVTDISFVSFQKVVLKGREGASLVAQWLRVRLPVQGTRAQALVQEDPVCSGATEPVRHSY